MVIRIDIRCAKTLSQNPAWPLRCKPLRLIRSLLGPPFSQHNSTNLKIKSIHCIFVRRLNTKTYSPSYITNTWRKNNIGTWFLSVTGVSRNHWFIFSCVLCWYLQSQKKTFLFGIYASTWANVGLTKKTSVLYREDIL